MTRPKAFWRRTEIGYTEEIDLRLMQRLLSLNIVKIVVDTMQIDLIRDPATTPELFYTADILTLQWTDGDQGNYYLIHGDRLDGKLRVTLDMFVLWKKPT